MSPRLNGVEVWRGPAYWKKWSLEVTFWAVFLKIIDITASKGQWCSGGGTRGTPFTQIHYFVRGTAFPKDMGESCISVNRYVLLVRHHLKYVWFTKYTKFGVEVKNGPSLGISSKKAQLWLRNPRDATAFQIHPEDIHRNEHSVRLLPAWNSVFSK